MLLDNSSDESGLRAYFENVQQINYKSTKTSKLLVVFVNKINTYCEKDRELINGAIHK